MATIVDSRDLGGDTPELFPERCAGDAAARTLAYTPRADEHTFTRWLVCLLVG
jgi:hypothetical protein